MVDNWRHRLKTSFKAMLIDGHFLRIMSLVFMKLFEIVFGDFIVKVLV